MLKICDNRNYKSSAICDFIDSAAFAVCDNREMTKALINWIETGLKKPGKTKGGLAKAMGANVHPSVVTRILSNDRRVQTAEIPKIAKYLDLPPPPIVGDDAVLSNAQSLSPEVRMARVVGEVSASNWKEAEIFNTVEPDLPGDFNSDRFAPVAFVPERKYRGLPLFAVHVVGNSVNAVIQDGSYAICVPYWEARKEITEGDLVVIQRKRPDGLYEATIKQVRRDRKGWELRPVSHDPAHQSPLAYKEAVKKSEIVVEIIGLVIGHAGPVKLPTDS